LPRKVFDASALGNADAKLLFVILGAALHHLVRGAAKNLARPFASEFRISFMNTHKGAPCLSDAKPFAVTSQSDGPSLVSKAHLHIPSKLLLERGQ
jgi:hypothetical protein